MEMEKPFRIQARAFLLTWNNSTGNVTFGDIIDFLERDKKIMAYSVCEEKATRTHFHAYLQYATAIDREAPYYKIKGEPPGDIQVNGAKRNHAQQAAEGHFYCYNKYKISHVQSITTCTTRAQCSAIYHMVTKGKMKPEHALDCATEYEMVVGIEAMKRNIDALMSLKKRKRMEEYEQKCLVEAQSAITKPFRTYPEVNQFMEQYDEVMSRYKFLIIVGPTRLGKTEFARKLYPRPLVFSQSTNWKEFDPFLHDSIIFDDVSQFEDGSKNIFQYVMRNKTLFQAGPVPITLGKSATDIFAYKIIVYRKPIVICCNWDAYEEIAESWIALNSYTLKIDECMYH